METIFNSQSLVVVSSVLFCCEVQRRLLLYRLPPRVSRDIHHRNSVIYEILVFRDLDEKLGNEERELKKFLSSVSPPDRSLRAFAKEKVFEKATKTRLLRETIFNYRFNESEVVRIKCGLDGYYLKVGVNEYRTDPRDMVS
jgi:hypothetical protein